MEEGLRVTIVETTVDVSTVTLKVNNMSSENELFDSDVETDAENSSAVLKPKSSSEAKISKENSYSTPIRR